MKNHNREDLSPEALAMYRENILDHARHPRHFGPLPNAKCRGRATNPLCGDEGEIFLAFGNDGRAERISFEGKGCAISQASLSLLTEAVKGKTREELKALTDEDIFALLRIPITYTRNQCALLSLRALKKALTE